jgi:hypothetical protein
MNNKRELKLLVAHLSSIAGLRARPFTTRAPVRWDRWMELVDENQLGAFLGARLATIAACELELPGEIADELRARYLRSGLDAAFRSTEVVRLLDRLEAPAQPVLLKGAALAHGLYADAAEREMSDIDLLVSSPEKAERAEALLALSGYHPRGKVAPDHHHRAPMFNGASELTFEVHTNLTKPPLPHTAIVEMCASRQRIELAGAGCIYVLDPIAATIHHALHAVADPIDSPLLRNIFELAWLTNRLSCAERRILSALVKRWGVERRVAPAFRLAHRLFGTPLLVKKPLGARELWSLVRLRWTRSRGHRGAFARFLRDVATRHLALLDRSTDPRNPIAFARAIFSAGARAIGARVEALRLRRHFERKPAETIAIGDCLLVHESESGRVHVLGPLPAMVWTATERERDLRRLREQLRGLELPKAAAHRALDQLFAHGLLL